MFKLMYEVPKTPCILSPYEVNSDGYASIKIRVGSKYKSVKHHRLVYAAAHNLTPLEMKDLVVMHKCDVRNCINPEHLLLGTVAMNNQDKLQKGRNVGFAPANRYQLLGKGNTKLTAAQVAEIRNSPNMTQRELAIKYKITQANVSKILCGQSHKYSAD